MSRNRNNSMQPMPNIRDNYYNKGPTPAVFNQDNNNCLFDNDNYKKTTSDNTINYDNSVNSIQQMNFKQNEYKNSNFIDNNIDNIPKEDIIKEITLVVDSMDRDMDIYPNSFDFKVRFNPSSSDKQPYINKKLENIISIELEAIILPNYYKLEKINVPVGDTRIENTLLSVLNKTLTPFYDSTYTHTSTFDGSSNTVVNLTNDRITINSHGFTTGDSVIYKNGNETSITGLSDSTTYYIIRFDDNTIELASTLDNANGGTQIDLIALGTGTAHTIESTSNKITIIWRKQSGTTLNIDFFDDNDDLKHEKVYSAVIVDTTISPLTITSPMVYYTYKTDNPIKISDDRFVFMEIDELKGIDDYSTDVYRGHSFGTLYHYDTRCNNNVCYMKTIYSEIQFPNSNLKNLSSLSIKMYSSVGEALQSKNNKNTDITNKTKVNEYNNGKIKYVSASRYIRHPLYLYDQCHFIFKIKYIEPSINKINFN